MPIALKLLAEGHQVTVLCLEEDERTASWGNAGHLAIEQVEPLASLATIRAMPSRLFWRGGAVSLPVSSIASWLPFAAHYLLASLPGRFASGKATLEGLLADAIPAWRRLARDVGEAQLIREDGHFICWETPEAARRGHAAWKGASTGTATVRDVDAHELAALAALVGEFPSGAVRIEGSGQIADPTRLFAVMRQAFRERGGAFRYGRVARIAQADDGGVEIDPADGPSFRADVAIVCAGARSGDLLRPLGYKVPLIDERGYHIEMPVTAAQWPADMPPVVFEDRQMIVTRFETTLRAASFVEFARPSAAPDPSKWRRLRRHCAELGLPIGDEAKKWVGSRPTLPDYLPAIGRSDRVPGLYYAFGHQHLGLTLSATTAEMMARLIEGEAADPALSLNRF